MTSHSDQPAFPTLADNGHLMTQDGMTLRDYFAAKAMQALVTSTRISDARLLAVDSYAMADAMLKERDGKADQPEDPCPGCRPGVVCRTPSCGRLKARDGSR